MSDIEQKPDETDAASELLVAEPDNAETQNQARAEARAGRSQAPLWFVVLLLLIGLLSASYFFWQQLEQQQSKAMQSLQSWGDRLEQLQQTQAKTIKQLENAGHALTQLEDKNQLLASAVEQVSERLGRGRHAWVMAEAEYLLQMANRRLLLERDVSGAIVAMNTADQRLASLSDPQLTGVRGQLNEELQLLRAVPVIDVEGIALEIAALSKGVGQLELAGNAQAIEPAADEDSTPDGWRGMWTILWQDVRSLLVIHRHEADSLPLITPEQRLLLQQNLRLKLETARLALLRGQAQTYRSALLEADEWIARFYLVESAATTGLRASLARLAAINIAPELPGIEKSLHDMREISTRLAGGEQP
ncbi:MAG: uroporphyrinogen-III C-methyltransferase [Thiohalomonadaceae bacterium]